MIYVLSSFAKLSVNIPEFNGWFMHYVFYATWSGFSCGSIFYVHVVSIMLNTNNPVSQSSFSWLLILEIDPCLLIGKKVVFLSIVSCAFLNDFHQVSSSQCLGQVDEFLNWVFQILGHLRSIALVPDIGVGAGLDLFCRLERKVSLP